MMAHTYSNLYGLNTVGLRFFTVYGPWGRPDMALIFLQKQLLKIKQSTYLIKVTILEVLPTLMILQNQYIDFKD